MSVQVLDCTLRDGGYINNWLFGLQHIGKIIQNLVDSHVDSIELGYLTRRPYNDDSTLFSCIEDIIPLLDSVIPVSKVPLPLFYVMINWGDYDINDLPMVEEGDKTVKGIRLAFHKKDLYSIKEDIAALTHKQYNVCVQPMITTLYSEDEIDYLLSLHNEFNVKALYIVDSFGNLTLETLRAFNKLYHTNLKNSISIGLHLHDNMQTSMANAMEFIGLNPNRSIILDASISGIGRGAGNLNSEITMQYLNVKGIKKYDTLPLLELIDEYFELLKKETGWGYSIAFFLSAINNCHPNYASYYVNKKQLTVRSIKELIERLPSDQALYFNESYAKQHLDHYLESKQFDGQSFDYTIIQSRPILLLGSGPTIGDYHQAIHQFIQSHQPIVISLNFIPSTLEVDYLFFSNEKRFYEYYDHELISHHSIITTSNINLDVSHMTLNLNALRHGTVKTNNICLMFLNLCVQNGCKEIYLAGIDGYDSNKIDNYFHKEYSQVLNKEELHSRNKHLSTSFQTFKQYITLHWVTPSQFETV